MVFYLLPFDIHDKYCVINTITAVLSYSFDIQAQNGVHYFYSQQWELLIFLDHVYFWMTTLSIFSPFNLQAKAQMLSCIVLTCFKDNDTIWKGLSANDCSVFIQPSYVYMIIVRLFLHTSAALLHLDSSTNSTICWNRKLPLWQNGLSNKESIGNSSWNQEVPSNCLGNSFFF